jgi:hypothetical protein
VVSSETDFRLCGGKERRRGFSRLAIKPGFAALKFRFCAHAHAQAKTTKLILLDSLLQETEHVAPSLCFRSRTAKMREKAPTIARTK